MPDFSSRGNSAGRRMQKALLQPSERPCLPFSEFLVALFQALAAEGLRPCVLRNYEGFPTQNVGGDLDFLIPPSELPRAIRALRTIHGIRIVGSTDLAY